MEKLPVLAIMDTVTPGEYQTGVTMTTDKLARIIEFSGIDGSGKTTALRFFITELERLGKRVFATRAIGANQFEVCSRIRGVTIDPGLQMTEVTRALLFTAMRVQNQTEYGKLLKDYDYIVSDRGYLCARAYTAASLESTEADFLISQVIDALVTRPDLAIYIDCPIDIARERRTRRNGPVDAIEGKGDDFLAAVHRAYDTHMHRCWNDMQIYRVPTKPTKEEMQWTMESLASKVIHGYV